MPKFYKQFTPEQLSSIRVVTGDGVTWITECVMNTLLSVHAVLMPFMLSSECSKKLKSVHGTFDALIIHMRKIDLHFLFKRVLWSVFLIK